MLKDAIRNALAKRAEKTDDESPAEGWVPRNRAERRMIPRSRFARQNPKQLAMRRAFRGIVPRDTAWGLMLDGQAARRKAS